MNRALPVGCALSAHPVRHDVSLPSNGVMVPDLIQILGNNSIGDCKGRSELFLCCDNPDLEAIVHFVESFELAKREASTRLIFVSQRSIRILALADILMI